MFCEEVMVFLLYKKVYMFVKQLLVCSSYKTLNLFCALVKQTCFMLQAYYTWFCIFAEKQNFYICI